MPKKPKEVPAEKKIADGKKASRASDKKARNNKIKKEADKMLMNMAADLSGAGGKFLINCAKEIDKLDAESAKIRLARKGVRAKMKQEKVILEVFDAVMKMRKREPEEQAMYRATEAIYTQQLEMPLSAGQKEAIAEAEKQREKMKAAMTEITGGSSGKEIGSGVNGVDDSEEEQEEVKPAAKLVSSVPAENKTVGGGFKVVAPLAAGSVQH